MRGQPGAARERALVRRRHDRVFYGAMALVLAAIVFAGFARTFYLRPAFTAAALPPLVVLHGLIFSSWIVLLIAQTTLVAAGRTDLHRRLGVAGIAVTALMILVGPLTAILAARRDPSTPALEFLVVPLTDIVVFGTLVGIAFLRRAKSETHKRLMLLASIALLPAAIARLPLDFIREGTALPVFALADVPVAACFAYDLAVRGRLHPALLSGGLFIVASQPLRTALGGTEAWLALARWLVA